MPNCLCPNKFCGIGLGGQGDMGNLRTVKDKGALPLRARYSEKVG